MSFFKRKNQLQQKRKKKKQVEQNTVKQKQLKCQIIATERLGVKTFFIECKARQYANDNKRTWKGKSRH